VLAGGPKRSGAPFSAAERDLLRGLASQTGLALRNLGSIQALREAQSALLRSERLAAIGEFAGAVAHGIRNPLAGIRAATQNARERSEDPALTESLSHAIAEVDRLEQRMRSLLDFSRPFEPKAAVVDVRALMEAVARTLRSRADRQQVEIRVDGPESGPQVHTDPDFLEEVLLELAGNALRYMPAGGTLGFQASSKGAQTTLRVSDTGPGVPAGVRDRVFDLFFTTRAEGTGLGLAMVKKIVERQGGSVALESSGPSGTVFRIDLP
jgi:signal transduction histidine kinase